MLSTFNIVQISSKVRQIMKLWYLIQFKPNCHWLAERNLKRQGFKTFLPLLEVTRKSASKFINEVKPLFPGYMFVKLDPQLRPWIKINSTIGVSRLVSFDQSPTPLPKGLVLGLSSRCDNNGKLLSSKRFNRGDTIRLLKGPLANFIGKIETIDSTNRIWVLMEIMGQVNRVQVAIDQIKLQN